MRLLNMKCKMTNGKGVEGRIFSGLLALVLGVVLLHPTGVFAANTGTTAGQFLEVPVGARATAMGSAQGAMTSDATTLYYNPASLATLSGGNVTLMYADYVKDIGYQQAAIAQNMGALGTWALGYQGMTYGDFDRVDNTGLMLGSSFEPADMAATLGFGKSLADRWDVGVGVKWISSEITEKADAFAFDAGTRYRMGKVALALSAANLGTGLEYQQTEDDLPQTFRLGSAFHAASEGRWIITADAVAPKGADVYGAVGTEYGFRVSASTVAARAGFTTRQLDSDMDGLDGFNAGLGFSIASFLIDYAWTPFGDLGDIHRISLGYAWGWQREAQD